MMKPIVCAMLLLAALNVSGQEMVDWQLQEAGKVTAGGEVISSGKFDAKGWLKATVPGTVLTSLVNNGVYPDPMYGENNRPDVIPDSLCRTDWWYRGTLTVPAEYQGKKIWLNFDGINYLAKVWVNGTPVGDIKGAFIRGVFDVTGLATPGQPLTVAVRVTPPLHPGIPAEHTLGAGNGPIGGVTGYDGATFTCSIGWDWMPGIRDRNTGIWQKVSLSASGPVVLKDPYVSTDLPLPRTDEADIAVLATALNVTDQPQRGVLRGSIAGTGIVFEKTVELPPRGAETVDFSVKKYPQLRLANPRLWWPNGYGEPNMYTLTLTFTADGQPSDTQTVPFGIRKITYLAPDMDKLSLTVNGVRVYCKGGNWGMDDVMKRIPRARLAAQLRMHRLANFNMVRIWGGQSTGEDFYALCDQLGLLVWDEFFQINAVNPLDLGLYMANCRDKVLRFRNHPSIAVWCGRNEATPPPYLNNALRGMLTELDAPRFYQPNSGDGLGANSGGPYEWRTPYEYAHFTEDDFNKNETFKTELGAVSVPTIESIQGMMPERDWHDINDDWAQHDFTAGGAKKYPALIAARYGASANLADFVRKSQLMNYEAYRAMYEGRMAQMFRPTQGLLIWMSHPGQPSFVWQLYHHDLEPNAALFAVRNACEPVHVQLNDVNNGTVQVVNHLPRDLKKATARLTVVNLDGAIPHQRDYEVNMGPCSTVSVGGADLPAGKLSPAYFVKLTLRDAGGRLLSENFYWRGFSADKNKPGNHDLTALDTLPVIPLDITAKKRAADGQLFLDLTVRNPAKQVALMAHFQLRRGKSKDRVLPAYYTDNYISLLPGETRALTVEASLADLRGEKPLITVDGWNIAVNPLSGATDADIALNDNAQPANWPQGGEFTFRQPAVFAEDEVRLNTGGWTRDGFRGDPGYPRGIPGWTQRDMDTAGVPHAAPEAIYQTVRWGECQYPLKLKDAKRPYLVRLHFAEMDNNTTAGKRVFNISINGKLVLTDLDVAAEVGQFKALVKEIPHVQPDPEGIITIGAESGKKGSPQISGIEILKEP